MRRTLRVTIRLSLIPALLAGAFALPSISAPAQQNFLVPHDESYGLAQCQGAGSSCARTLADAWCAAMGRGPSVSFGMTEEAAPRSGGLRITCG